MRGGVSPGERRKRLCGLVTASMYGPGGVMRRCATKGWEARERQELE